MTGREQALKNIKRIKRVFTLVKESQEWLDEISNHEWGDMSLRLGAIHILLVVEMGILEREMTAFDDD